MNDWLLWPTTWSKSTITLADLGLLGDYIGGVFGTALTALTLLVVFRTFSVTRKSANLNSTISILAEMLKTHDSNILSSKIAIAQFHRDFSRIYKFSRIVRSDEDRWRVEDRVDIAFTFAYYGLTTQAQHSLRKHGRHDIKLLSDKISHFKHRAAPKLDDYFRGHQPTLSHYFRNIYAMYKFLDSASISASQKLALGSVIRSKLSNYEQALLLLNAISDLGSKWEIYKITQRYQPFSNVPEKFFGFDTKFEPKELLPHVKFDWESEISTLFHHS